ncbi:hypothetical protein PIB30_048242 [Stylosanthes scabra]|uniref:Uncharacterized protein n=1 Tax=Stylosanthes scabra TaxID=79078 RepID=A0ABU6WFJ1_9FABA|nr:hypothetical protein [Stylosanthes scabra]
MSGHVPVGSRGGNMFFGCQNIQQHYATPSASTNGNGCLTQSSMHTPCTQGLRSSGSALFRQGTPSNGNRVVQEQTPSAGPGG